MGETGSSDGGTRRFECSVPGCDKLFRRKEHLTRHLKSHDSLPQYVCPICGRRYARSDVLKRHIDFHPQTVKTARRSFVACHRCHENKIKCDDDNPCKPCARRSLKCVRDPHSTEVTILGEPLNIKEYLAHNENSSERRLNVFKTHIHPLWPVLLSPAPADGLEDIVMASIMLLASWVEGGGEDGDHEVLFPLIYNEICGIQMDSFQPPLATLQAMVFCLIYMISNLATEGMPSKALKIHNHLVTACRFSGILASQGGMWYSCNQAPIQDEEVEQRHRLAFAVLRLDAYLSALTDFAPLIRYQELSMPLSKSTCWTPVSSEEERSRLLQDEPSMRKRTPFSFRVHDLLGTPRPNALAPPWSRMDYHFVLCAVQSGAWEAAHQALRTLPDNLHSRTQPHDVRNIWRGNLEVWKFGLEKDCRIQTKTYVHPNNFHRLRKQKLPTTTTNLTDPINSQSLFLYHITSLKLHAPSDLLSLQHHYYNPPLSSSSVSSRSNSLQSWQPLKSARLAIWHAAQIARLFIPTSTSSTPVLNPLAIPALLMSARTTIAFAYHSHVCPLCTGSDVLLDLVNPLEAPEDCIRLARWVEEGAGLLDWGGTLFTASPLCQCSRKILSDWFRRLLASDPRADAAFLAFLDEIERGLW
ncbi:hypothetical protein GGS20DRAFT_500838 [Poronia punctata]|nr:hypothetical protein GGS20DRAFT_500838 [Poronia punctata]